MDHRAACKLLQRLPLSAVHSGIASHAVMPGLQAQEVAQLAINARESARATTKRLEAARYSSRNVDYICSPTMYVLRSQREFLWEGRGPSHSMEALYGLTCDLAGRLKLCRSDRSSPCTKICAHAIISAYTKLPLGGSKIKYSCMARD